MVRTCVLVTGMGVTPEADPWSGLFGYAGAEEEPPTGAAGEEEASAEEDLEALCTVITRVT